jgi:hypothetical protein
MKDFMKQLIFGLLSLSIFLLMAGCDADGDSGSLRNSQSVDGAADHLTDAFDGSSAKLKKHAQAASDAMRKKKYKSALISIQEIKLSGQVGSVSEGVAVRDSLINLEQELIGAMEDGDPNAAKSYQLLKRINQN